jgi:hypothetical protein
MLPPCAACGERPVFIFPVERHAILMDDCRELLLRLYGRLRKACS